MAYQVKVNGPIAQALLPLLIAAIQRFFAKQKSIRQQPGLNLTVEVGGKPVTIEGDYNKVDSLRRLVFVVKAVDGEAPKLKEPTVRERRAMQRHDARGGGRRKRPAHIQVTTGENALAAMAQQMGAKVEPETPKAPAKAAVPAPPKQAAKKAAKQAPKAAPAKARRR